MKLTAHTKTMNKTVTNIVAVVTALSLVFLQVPILTVAQEARADAAAEISAQAEETGSVDVGFSFDHTFINYDGQVLAPPASVLTLPAGNDLVFTAEADSGYEVELVEATLGGATTTLSPDGSGKYRISASSLLDGTASVYVGAINVPEEEVAAEGEAVEEPAAADEPAADAADEPAADAVDDAAADADAATDEPAADTSADEPAADAAADLVAEARNTQEKFTYEDDDVKVTVKLADPAALPAGVEFVVTPVTAKTQGYNYDAYMEALNAEAEQAYTAENTLLYDIAFMHDGKEVALAEGAADVTFKFKDKQLTSDLNAAKAADVEVIHLPLIDSAKEGVDSTAAATDITATDIAVEVVDADTTLTKKAEKTEFTTDGFSVYAMTTGTVAGKEDAAITIRFANIGEASGNGPSGSYKLFVILARGGQKYYAVSDELDAFAGGVIAVTPEVFAVSPWTQTSVVYESGDALEAFLVSGLDYDWQEQQLSSGSVPYGVTKYTNGSLVEDSWKFEVALPGETLSDAPETPVRTLALSGAASVSTAAETSNYDGDFDEDTSDDVTVAPNPLATHTVKVETYGNGGTTMAAPNPALSDQFYMLATLTSKTTGNVRGWALKKFDINSATPATLEFTEFWKAEPNFPTDSKIYYDSSVYKLSVRMYHSSDATLDNFLDFKGTDASVEDTVKNYAITSSKSDTETVIALTKEYQAKSYVVRIDFDSVGSTLSASDNCYVFVDLEHQSTGHSYYLQKLDGISKTTDIMIDQWLDQNGTAKNTEFTGNEKSVTLRLAKALGNVGINNFIQKNDNVSFVEDDQYLKEYKVGYEGITHEVDTAAQTTRYVDVVRLSPASASSDYNYLSILSQGVAYGITAHEFEQQNHIQSNFATNLYNGHSNPVEADLGSASGAYVIASAVPSEDSQIFIGGKHSGDVIIYADPTQAGRVLKDPRDFVQVMEMSGATMSASMVEPIINHGDAISAELLTHAATTAPSFFKGKALIDTTAYPADATIYIDADAIANYLNQGKLLIRKQEGQTIVFNFKTTTSVDLGEYYIQYPDMSAYSGADLQSIGGFDGRWIKSDTPTSKGAKNDALDGVARHVVWNLASVDTINIGIGAGIFLMPRETSRTTVYGTSSGWIISDGYVTNTGGEWHSVYGEMPDVNEANLTAYKTVDSKLPKSDQKFTFTFERYDANAGEWTGAHEEQNEGASIAYSTKDLSEGWNVFRITETAKAAGTEGSYTLDTSTYYAACQYTVVNGKHFVSVPQYFKNFDAAAFNPSAGALSGLSDSVSTAEFNNTTSTIVNYEPITLAFTASKTLAGGALAGGDFEFELKNAEGSVLQTKSNAADGQVAFDALEFTQEMLGSAQSEVFTYTISEKIPADAVNDAGIEYRNATDDEKAAGGFKKDDISYDGHVTTKTVTVTKSGSKLVATVATSGGSADFTNTKSSKTSAGLEVSKSYAPGLADGRFSFELRQLNGADDAEGALVETATNDASGKVAFSDIEYTQAGTYRYLIREVIPSGSVDLGNSKWKNAGVVYDAHAVYATVEVAANEAGELAATTSYEGATTFENDYQADGTKTVFTANKTLTGASVADHAFSFQLLNEDGSEVLQTVATNETGLAQFAEVEYAQAGTYKYLIRELVPDAATEENGYTVDGITYDTHTVAVSVTVTDNAGKLEAASPVYEPGKGESAAFANAYNSSTELVLQGSKAITGRPFNGSDEATFTISAIGENADEAPLPEQPSVTVTPDAGTQSAAFKFGAIEFNQDHAGKTFRYQVVESSASMPGTTADQARHEVTVTVTDDGKGTLTATPSYSAAALNFTNAYDAKGSATISGEKSINNARIARYNGKFQFDLKDANGTTLGTATNDASGAFSFATINYTLDQLSKTDAKTGLKYDDFSYTVSERAGSLGGVTYDDEARTVTVHVADNGEGTLVTTVSSNGGEKASFHNSYNAEGDASFAAHKSLTGRPMKTGEFSFTLAGHNADQTKANGATGDVAFDKVHFTLADLTQEDEATGLRYDDFTYTIKEVVPADAKGVTYDTTEHQVRVHVADAGNGTLDVSYQLGDEAATATMPTAEFGNVYDAKGAIVLDATKALAHKALEAGAFEFALYDAAGTQIATAKNDANGKVAFAKIDYELADLNQTDPATGLARDVFTYSIRELLPEGATAENGYTVDGITYDTNPIQVEVTVTDNGEGTLLTQASYAGGAAKFENTYDAHGSITLDATKLINGKAPAEGAPAFTFELTGEGLAAPIYATTNAEGVATFDAIGYEFADLGYERAKTFSYTVREVIPAEAKANGNKLAGYTYDDHEARINVTVTDDGLGTLVTESSLAEGSEPATFDNAYEAEGSAQIVATKQAKGGALAAEGFTFQLLDNSGNVVDEATSAADGSVVFKKIDYSLEDAGKTYDYTIREVLPEGATEQNGYTVNGVSYDAHEATVQVTVGADQGDGTLAESTVTYAADTEGADAVFTNTYDARGTTTITGTKTLENRDFAAGEFLTFSIRATGDNAASAPMPAQREIQATPSGAAPGNTMSIDFGEIEYTLADAGNTYIYEVTESGALAGVTSKASEAVHTVTVKVADAGDGTLKVERMYSDGAELSFTNTYDANGSAQLEAHKQLTSLNDMPLAADKFTFLLKDASGATLQTKTNAADGTVAFDAINYTRDMLEGAQEKTFDYTILEQKGTATGVGYDESVKTAHVRVVDNGAGTLETEVAYDNNDNTFTNTYEAKGYATIEGAKRVENRSFQSGDAITFTIARVSDVSGAPLPASTEVTIRPESGNTAAFAFGQIEYTSADAGKTYTYVITEQAAMAGTQPDAHSHFATVKVGEDDGSGVLATEVSYASTGEQSFVNSYDASGSIELAAKKVLNSVAGEKPVAEAQYTFQLLAADGSVLSEKANGADGTLAFDALTYGLADAGKTFTYTVHEVAGDVAGVTYAADQTITVTVGADEGTGELAVTADKGQSAPVEFTNTYKAQGQATVTAHKSLTGRTLAADQFTFQLLDAAGNTLQTAQNKADGNIAFAPLTYTLADAGKTFTYKVVESAPAGDSARGGYTYDTHAETVSVSVAEDEATGVLGTTVAYDGDGAEFTNAYEATGEVAFTALKQLAGRTLAAGQFSFELKDSEGKLLQTKTNAADGSVAFDKIVYTQDDYNKAPVNEQTGKKTLVYTISEVDGKAKGYTSDASTYRVVVTLEDNGEGTIEATATYADGQPVFSNTYTATGEFTLAGTKAMDGRAFQAGDAYTFTVSGSDGAPLPSPASVTIEPKKGSEAGFAFNTVKYGLADVGKTYTYTIAESGTHAGVTNDAAKQVRVSIADNGDGTLKVTPNYGEAVSALEFTNTYEASGSAVISGTKALTGAKVSDYQFRFQLQDAQGNEIQTVTSSDGSFAFAPINYTLADLDAATHEADFSYQVVELDDGLAGITYDTAVKTIKVHVADTGAGTLQVSYPESGNTVAFTNAYTATGEAKFFATKSMTGRAAAERQFAFELIGEGVDQTVANDANGNVAFEPIAYTQNDLGTHVYTIKEVLPKDENGADANVMNGVTYDTVAHQVAVTVADNGDGTLAVTYGDQPTFPGVAFANAYDAHGSVVFEAGKTLTGRDLAAGEFSFALKDASGATLQTKANGEGEGVAADKVVFDPIRYQLSDAGKTFTYTISELAGADNAIDYDAHVETVTVEVVDYGNGMLGAAPTYDADGAKFANSYHATGSIALEAAKTLNGKAPAEKAGQFSFTLSGGNLGDTVLTATSAADGTIAFPAIDYTEADAGKTYTYTVRENQPAGEKDAKGNVTVAGITYDGHSQDVKVKVTDDGKGTLTAKVVGTEAGEPIAIFANKYKATGDVVLAATKTLNGKAIEAGAFSFELKDAEGATLQTKASDENGAVAFDAIEYAIGDVGEHAYTVCEVIPADAVNAEGVSYAEASDEAKAAGGFTKAGVSYDGHVENVTVVVRDLGGGKLEAVAHYDADGAAFANDYAAVGETSFEGVKQLEGRNFHEGDSFTFTVTADDAQAPMPENSVVTIDPTEGAEAALDFGTVSYTLADAGKTYTYTIAETGSGAGVANDTAVHAVTVKVTDNGDGTLNVARTYSDGERVSFTNDYSAEGTATVEAAKSLQSVSARALGMSEFSFELRDSEGAVLGTATNDVQGAISFPELHYTLADAGTTFDYTIHEVAGAVAGVTYDEAVKTAHVAVADAGDGTLKTTVTYENDDKTFTNAYEAAGEVELHGVKHLDGRSFKDGDEITFTVTADDASAPMYENNSVTIRPTEGNDAAFSFGKLRFTSTNAEQDYTYTITEQATIDGVTNDSAEHAVTVHVGKDQGTGVLPVTADYSDGLEAKFTNSYDANGAIVLHATKRLENKELAEGQFAFQLLDADNGNALVSQATNAADGAIVFDELSYGLDQAGTVHHYLVRELKPTDENGAMLAAKDGTSYAIADEPITVTVAPDEGTGTLAVESDRGTTEQPILFTNTYTAKGSAVVTANKELAGRALAADQFSFTLSGGNLAEPLTATNALDGSISFPAIEYSLADEGQTYTYTIAENVPGEAVNADGVKYAEADADTRAAGGFKLGAYSYDAHEETVTVTVGASDGAGTLPTEVAYDADGATFANAYEATGSVAFTATKELVGHALAAGQFSFELKDEAGKVLQTKQNVDGAVAFDEIAYTQADAGKTFHYSISEVDAAAAGYTYSTAEFGVDVVVTDNGDGTLTATENYLGGPAAFANTYEAAGKFTLAGEKTLAGREFKEGDEFTFSVVADSEQAPLPENSVVSIRPTEGNEAAFSFGAIEYGLEDVGQTYTYTISETADIAGVTNDAAKQVSVAISDKGDGTLAVEPSYGEADALVFANTYRAEGKATIELAKDYNSWNDSSAFEFSITAAEGAPLPDPSTVVVTAASSDKTASFGDIAFTEADLAGGEVVDGKLTKAFTYTVQENAPASTNDGITYDIAPRTVTITATDNGDGTITVTQAVTKEGEPADLTFHNSYDATGSVIFQGEKTMVGRDLTADDSYEFAIQQVDESGAVLKDVGVAKAEGESGQIAYPAINYTRDDMLNADGTYAASKTFHYTVTEVVPADAVNADGVKYAEADAATKAAGGFFKDGVTYSSEVKTFTVEVTDDGKGELNAVATVDADASAAAANDAEANAGEAEGLSTQAASVYENASRSSAGLFKTATNLNGNYDSTVRIKLQGEAAPEPEPEPAGKTFDVVFVVDKSQSQGDSATELMNTMFQEAEKGGYKVNIGIVTYYYVAKVTRNLDGSAGWNGSGSIAGTNLPAGILLGTKMLDDDTTVADEDKYLVVLSDGDTYIYQNDNQLNAYTDGKGVLRTVGDDAMVVTQKDSRYTSVPFAGPGSYSWKYFGGNKEPQDFAAPADWDAYFATVEAQVAADQGAYETKWDWHKNNLYADATNAIPEDEIADHANSADTSLYYSLVDYRAAAAKYHAYAAFVKGGYDRPYGASFMAYLNGGASFDLSKLESALVTDLASAANSSVAKGGVINDTIGYGYDDKGNAYDMDFVNDINTTDIVLNGKVLSKTTNEDGSFAFGTGSDGSALFTLSYTGKAEPGTEGYTVQFSDSVLATDTVEMRYNVHLANPQKASGTYGNYAETGEPADVPGLLVSSGATFTRGESTQVFANPVVSYSALGFTNIYKTGTAQLKAVKALDGRVNALKANEFSFELLEGGEVLQTMSNQADGQALFEPITYHVEDLGVHTYQVRELVPADAVNAQGVTYADADEAVRAEGGFAKDGVTYDNTVHDITVTVTDNNDGTLGVAYAGYDPDAGAAFTNTYHAKGEIQLTAQKTFDGKPLAAEAAGAYQFQVLDKNDNPVLTEDGKPVVATNDAEGNIIFPKFPVTSAGDRSYKITEVVPDGAQALGAKMVADNVAYDDSVCNVKVSVIDNGDGTLTAAQTTYDGAEAPKVFDNASVGAADFELTATKAMVGRAFNGAEEYSFTVEGSEGAPEFAEKTVTVKPEAGTTEAAISFGTVTFGTEALNQEFTYTINEVVPAADEAVPGVTYDSFAHVVKVKVIDDNGTLKAQVVDGSEGTGSVTITNTYEAAGTAQFFAQKTLEGRALKDAEFSFTLKGGEADADPIELHAQAGADGRAEFAPIAYTLADAGKDFHYTIAEDMGALAGVTYDTTVHEVTVHVADAGDGTLEVTYEGYDPKAGAAFTNTYEAASTQATLVAKKVLSGSALAEGQFSFTLRGTSDNAKDTQQTVKNAADGTVAFDAIEYTQAGTYDYEIREVVPEGAVDNGDGTFRAGTVIYDGTAHTAQVVVTDNGAGALEAEVTYDGYTSLTITNGTLLANAGFEFDKYLFGADTGEFDFTLTAANADATPRTGTALAIADGAKVVDDGTSSFTLVAHNGAFANGKSKVVFPEITFTADGDYYYLAAEDEDSTKTMVTDEAQFLIHVKVTGGKVASTTYELLYEGENLGATDDLSFYNNSAVTLGGNSLSAQGYTDDAERVSVYPKVQKYLNGGTAQLLGGDFQFALYEEGAAEPLAVGTNDENGVVAFYDEEVDPGLAYDEPGTYRYTIREIAGEDAAMTYDSSVISLTVTVTADEETGALTAETLYNGQASIDGDASTPAFYNTKEGIDVRVQKVSREGGEGLADCTYALWMVGASGDVMVAEATSDAQGWITFENVDLMQGQLYYFKEVKAPAGHVVDPYRTAYFTLNNAGTALVLAEKASSDGWHAAKEVK